MKVYKHQSHTAVEIRPWGFKQTGIVIMLVKDKIPFFPIKECKCNWKLYFKEKLILLPFFYLDAGYKRLAIGLPRAFIEFWF